jgi:hypothetical protein
MRETCTPKRGQNANLFHSYDLHLHIWIFRLRNHNSSPRWSKRQLSFIDCLKLGDALITIPEINLPERISKKALKDPIMSPPGPYRSLDNPTQTRPRSLKDTLNIKEDPLRTGSRRPNDKTNTRGSRDLPSYIYCAIGLKCLRL